MRDGYYLQLNIFIEDALQRMAMVIGALCNNAVKVLTSGCAHAGCLFVLANKGRLKENESGAMPMGKQLRRGQARILRYWLRIIFDFGFGSWRPIEALRLNQVLLRQI